MIYRLALVIFIAPMWGCADEFAGSGERSFGGDSKAGDQRAASLGEGDGKEDDNDLIRDDDGKDSLSKKDCRFALRSYKEQVKGGPGVAFNPFELKNGNWEGNNYVFSLEAWQDFTNATGKVRVSDGAVIDVVHLKALGNVSGLNGGWALQAPAANWGVQHKYSGVLSNAKSESCELKLTENEVPFFDRPGDGCFALSTNILMADGSERPIYLLKAGDQVFNPRTKTANQITKILEGPEAKVGMIRITTSTATLLVTENHPFPNRFDSVIRAQDLKAGDRLMNVNGNATKVLKVERLPINHQQNVRNLVINPHSKSAEDHVIVANGVATGDFMMQTEKLERKPSIMTKLLAALQIW